LCGGGGRRVRKGSHMVIHHSEFLFVPVYLLQINIFYIKPNTLLVENVKSKGALYVNPLKYVFS
jgi:hypothetical protein